MSTLPCRIAIQNLFVEDPKPPSPRQVIEALRARYPREWTDGTVRADLIGLSVNHPSAHDYRHLQTFAFLTQTPDGRYAVAADAAANLGAPGAVLEDPIRRRSAQSRYSVRV